MKAATYKTKAIEVEALQVGEYKPGVNDDWPQWANDLVSWEYVWPGCWLIKAGDHAFRLDDGEFQALFEDN